jgi:hypothetical protein
VFLRGSHRGDSGSIPNKSTWDFWWPRDTGSGFSPRNLLFPLTVLFHHWCILITILPEEQTGEIWEPSNTALLDREEIVHCLSILHSRTQNFLPNVSCVAPLLLGKCCCNNLLHRLGKRFLQFYLLLLIVPWAAARASPELVRLQGVGRARKNSAWSDSCVVGLGWLGLSCWHACGILAAHYDSKLLLIYTVHCKGHVP